MLTTDNCVLIISFWKEYLIPYNCANKHLKKCKFDKKCCNEMFENIVMILIKQLQMVQTLVLNNP